MEKWISVKTRKPALGQKVLCFYVMTRYDGSIARGIRLEYYLMYMHDNRRRVFSQKYYDKDSNIGNDDWPVTHWMPLPEEPAEEG